jgi:hypothetical protein
MYSMLSGLQKSQVYSGQGWEGSVQLSGRSNVKAWHFWCSCWTLLHPSFLNMNKWASIVCLSRS